MDDDRLIWTREASEPGPDLPLFRVRFDSMRHPQTRLSQRCLVLETPDWVNVVAVTPEGRVVMVEQYRFGVGRLSLEPPAGIVGDGEKPLAAAQRELLEETGYGGDRWRYLGSVSPNAAFHDNRCHHWLVEDAEEIAAPSPDDGEAIRVRLMSIEDLRAEIAAGGIDHTLAQSALSRVFPLWSVPFVRPAPPEAG